MHSLTSEHISTSSEALFLLVKNKTQISVFINFTNYCLKCILNKSVIEIHLYTFCSQITQHYSTFTSFRDQILELATCVLSANSNNVKENPQTL